jgi:peroxiredoxin
VALRRRAGAALRALGPPALALLALALAGCPAPPSGAPDAAAAVEGAREPAPDFTLRDLAGAEVALSALRGQVVVIDFWATWCAPCIDQIPVLNALHDAGAARGVTVLGIAVDEGGEEAVHRFAERHGMRYRVLLGDERLARDWGALGFPTLFVVAPDGGVDSIHVGVIEAGELEAAVARARG